jgi:hypothetical protein
MNAVMYGAWVFKSGRRTRYAPRSARFTSCDSDGVIVRIERATVLSYLNRVIDNGGFFIVQQWT